MQTKEEKYAALLPTALSLMSGEEDEIARMANLAALLHNDMGFWWTGFYRVRRKACDSTDVNIYRDVGSGRDAELVLGPFQGPIACTNIPFGKGVCGTAWAQARTVVVPDVEQFPGHIACSGESRSEIVVPVRRSGEIVAVLDIDSRELEAFDETDVQWLEKIVEAIYGLQNEKPAIRDIWFAAGCFWGAQKFFKKINGVISTEVGFANGWMKDPTYKQVYTDTTGHAECVHVRYNPEIITLNELVRLYFRIIDPLSLNKQGEDEGRRYRTGVYYNNERDCEPLRLEFTRVEQALGCQIAVELEPLECFFPAEEYHQDYLDKTPSGYCHLSPELFNLAEKYRK